MIIPKVGVAGLLKCKLKDLVDLLIRLAFDNIKQRKVVSGSVIPTLKIFGV